MKIIIMVMISMIVSSCSSSRQSKQELKKIGAPEWVYAPDKACSKQNELCASGSGESLEEADLNAKKSLASIFETKITSNFEVQSTSLSSSEVEEMSEKVYSQVEESVDVVLKSASIKKRFLKDDNYFALVSLNKRKAANVLIVEVKELDDKLDLLFKENKRTNLKQMLFLFDKRQLLYERLLILDKKYKPSKYTFSQLASVKSKMNGSNIAVEYTEVTDATKKWFEDLLNSFGYKISNENIDYTIKLSKKVKEQYLNVNGFKKFQFNISAQATDKNNNKIGSFSSEVIATGRTDKDAYLKVKVKLYENIEKNIYKLNME